MPTYHVYRLDDALSPIVEVERVRSIRIDRSATDAAPLLESCTVTFDTDAPMESAWHRIEAHDGRRTALGTFWLEQDSTSTNGRMLTVTAKGRSVLGFAADSVLPSGAYCKAGRDAVEVASMYLADGVTGVTAEGQALLPRTIVFDDGETRLGAAWQLLDEVGYRIRLDGYGNVFVEPLPTEPSVRITASDPHGVSGRISTGESTQYTRTGTDDDMRPLDLVAVVLPRCGLDEQRRIATQSISCDTSMTTGETLKEVVRSVGD